jgi:hypothetical protein
LSCFLPGFFGAFHARCTSPKDAQVSCRRNGPSCMLRLSVTCSAAKIKVPSKRRKILLHCNNDQRFILSIRLRPPFQGFGCVLAP